MMADLVHKGDIADSGSPLSSLSPSPTARTSNRTPKSHGPKRDPKHISRSPNAFILYRSDFYKRGIIPTNVEQRQQNLSRIVGDCWRRLTPEELQYWHDLARQKEEEHKIKYPHYQFKPKKRVKARRRKPMSREEEIIHCTNLRETFVPDMTGPVLNPPGSQPARPRKSRAKPRATETERPVRTTRSSRAHATKRRFSRSPRPSIAPEGPVFMDPLLPPSEHPPSQLVGDTAILNPELEPPVTSGLPSHIDWEGECLLLPEVPVSLPETVEMQGPLDVGAHIRQQYDIVCHILPTMAMDFQDAEALYNPDLLSYPQSASHGQDAIFESFDFLFTAENTGWQYQATNSTTVPSSNNHPPTLLTIIEDFGALPDLPIPQPFPITLMTSSSTPLESLPLCTPTFDTPPNSLDTISFSFDQHTLDALAEFGLDGQFAEQLPGAFDALSSGLVKDIMDAEVCFTAVGNVV